MSLKRLLIVLGRQLTAVLDKIRTLCPVLLPYSVKLMIKPFHTVFVGVIRRHVRALLAEGGEHERSSHLRLTEGALTRRGWPLWDLY